MSAVKIAAKAIEDLEPGEFEEFLVWLSQRVSARLGDHGISAHGPSAREQVETHEATVDSGEAEPFRYVDLDRLPDPARKKAERIVADWRARYGS